MKSRSCMTKGRPLAFHNTRSHRCAPALTTRRCTATGFRCSGCPPRPQRSSDIFLFGGEYADLATGKVHVYRDLYRFNTDKAKWSRISAPNPPPPRSAHQAVVWKNVLLVFGGEFTSPNQEKFHHYKVLLAGGGGAMRGSRGTKGNVRARSLLWCEYLQQMPAPRRASSLLVRPVRHQGHAPPASAWVGR